MRNPIERAIRTIGRFIPQQAIRTAVNRDYNAACCRAADALADDEAEFEVSEPRVHWPTIVNERDQMSTKGICELCEIEYNLAEGENYIEPENREAIEVWHKHGHVGSVPIHGMDWLGWAVPAIMTELYTHFPQSCPSGYDCNPGTEDCPIWPDEQAWRDHVAPLIAKRISCDPPRAIAALSRTDMV